MSDRSVGGFSTAELSQVPPSTDPVTGEQIPTHALFHGNISTDLPKDRPDVRRTGYAAFRNQDRGRTLFGKFYWDVDSYRYLALRVKSDGRRYFVNIQTDSIIPTDLHQHRLWTKAHQGAPGLWNNLSQRNNNSTITSSGDGQWETILIKFHEFVRTNHGIVTEPQSEMLRQKITSFGIGLTDRQPGPFKLAIGAMWATNLNERGLLDGQVDDGSSSSSSDIGGPARKRRSQDETTDDIGMNASNDANEAAAAAAAVTAGAEAGEDLGSATLRETTVKKMAQRAEERRKLPDANRG